MRKVCPEVLGFKVQRLTVDIPGGVDHIHELYAFRGTQEMKCERE